jgi:hypothetical protein
VGLYITPKMPKVPQLEFHGNWSWRWESKTGVWDPAVTKGGFRDSAGVNGSRVNRVTLFWFCVTHRAGLLLWTWGREIGIAFQPRISKFC